MSVSLTCVVCGESYTTTPKRAVNSKWCSLQCLGEWRSENWSGKDHPLHDQKTLECEYCGESYTCDPHRADESRFCSRECLYSWRSENKREENHPRWEGITVECDYCGESIHKEPGEIEDYEHHFCDTECMSNHRSNVMRGQNHPNYDSVELACEWCNRTFVRAKEKAKRYRRDFCSRECYTHFQSESGLWAGENHPRWKGGTKGRYGPSWAEARTAALERDNHTCQKCGVEENVHKESHPQGRGLDVHHVRRVESFRGEGGEINWTAAHDLDNLLTVCQSCHGVLEHDS